MQDKNLDVLNVLKAKLDKERKAQMNKILKAISPELDKVETSIAELESDLQTREKALEFTSELEQVWDELKKTPGTRVYEINKRVKELEDSMEGKVNTAMVLTKVPVASPFWTQLATAKFELRGIRRAVGKEVAGVVKISPEIAQRFMDEEEKARESSKPNNKQQAVTAQTKKETANG
jgi:hypothetical protein